MKIEFRVPTDTVKTLRTVSVGDVFTCRDLADEVKLDGVTDPLFLRHFSGVVCLNSPGVTWDEMSLRRGCVCRVVNAKVVVE